MKNVNVHYLLLSETYEPVARSTWTGVIPCDILVPHIDSRVKIIDNERPGAGPCDLLLVIVRVL